MKVTAVIDRFEGSKAVLLVGETEVRSVWPRACLPAGAGEGDYLSLTVETDREATRMAKQEAEELLRQLQDTSEK